MPSVAAALWVQEEQARVAKLGGAESPLVLAERAWDAGRQQGRGEGRAQAGAAVLARDLRTLAAELIAASRDADELTLRSLAERIADELTNPTRPEPRANATPGDSSV